MKKINFDSPATKRDLKKLATKKELKRLASGLNKKIGGVEQKLGGVEKRLDGKIDVMEKVLRAEIKITAQETKEEIKEEFGKKLTKTESRILEAIDDFAKEVETAREERIIGSHQQAEDRKRIEALEQKVFAAT